MLSAPLADLVALDVEHEPVEAAKMVGLVVAGMLAAALIIKLLELLGRLLQTTCCRCCSKDHHTLLSASMARSDDVESADPATMRANLTTVGRAGGSRKNKARCTSKATTASMGQGSESAKYKSSMPRREAQTRDWEIKRLDTEIKGGLTRSKSMPATLREQFLTCERERRCHTCHESADQAMNANI